MKFQLRLIILIFLTTSVQFVQAAEVRVAVAANFLATLKALFPVYEQQTGDRLIISAGSSGKLFAQIINGAPYDVFLSADRAYPDRLIQKTQALASSRYVYATGVLVLWSAGEVPVDKIRLGALDVKHIAIANPNIAPYGAAAQQVLQTIGLWNSVKHKLVQGESVGQVFQFVASGNAQLGFVALSQVLNPNNNYNRNNYWRVPAEYYSPLEQEGVLLVRGKDNPAALRFLDFLKTDAAREVIAQYGYL